jgi:hypothetical protein
VGEISLNLTNVYLKLKYFLEMSKRSNDIQRFVEQTIVRVPEIFKFHQDIIRSVFFVYFHFLLLFLLIK